jgi:hypothetical protein
MSKEIKWLVRISKYQAHVNQACFCHSQFASVIDPVDLDQVPLVSAVQLVPSLCNIREYFDQNMQ